MKLEYRGHAKVGVQLCSPTQCHAILCSTQWRSVADYTTARIQKQDGRNKLTFKSTSVTCKHAALTFDWLINRHLVPAPSDKLSLCNNFRISGFEGCGAATRPKLPYPYMLYWNRCYIMSRPLLSPNMRRCSEENLVMLSQANCWWDAYSVRLRPHVQYSHSLQN